MLFSSQVIGFYRCKNTDGSDLYCYVTKMPSGEIEYKFTSDIEEASVMGAKFLNSNHYTKENFKQNINNYSDSFNLNCKNVEEVEEMIKRANPKAEILEDNYDEDNFVDRIKEKIANLKIGSKIKNLWLNKKVRRIVIGTVAVLGTIGITAYTLNRCTPDKDIASNTASTDKDKEKEEPKEEKKQEEKEDEKKEETTKTTTTDENYNSSNTTTVNNGTSNTTSSNSGSSSSNEVTKEPGSVDDSMNGFQNPDASLDDSNNGGSNNDNNDSNQTEDSYDNTVEEEVPVDNNSSDGDYSEEIDVSADDDELTDDNIDFDEGKEDNPAFDDDYTFEPNYSNEDSSDYEIGYAPLPDPNETAADGNYVSSEEEMNISEETNENVNNTNTTTDVDVVPVYQEEVPYTTDTASITTSSTENNSMSLENAVDQAIEGMANGEDVSLVYDPNTGQYSTEVTNSNSNVEENGLTK